MQLSNQMIYELLMCLLLRVNRTTILGAILSNFMATKKGNFFNNGPDNLS